MSKKVPGEHEHAHGEDEQRHRREKARVARITMHMALLAKIATSRLTEVTIVSASRPTWRPHRSLTGTSSEPDLLIH